MELVARQLLRAIRGSRSQLAFSRKLGYSGNPVAKWEGGHRYPTAEETFRACGLSGIDVDAVIEAFHPPAWPAWPDRWLEALGGDTPHTELARRSGLSRQQVGRALRGDSRPRLPQFLALVQAATGRVADLVDLLVDIDQVPALAREVALHRSVRLLAFDEPWSPAVLVVAETGGLDQLAERLHIEAAEAERLRAVVERSGALDPQVLEAAGTIDVAATENQQRALRAHWARVSADRMRDPSEDDVFSFNVFAASRRDLARIRELQRAFYREVRGIVSDSEPEVAAFLTVHTGTFEPPLPEDAS